MRQGYLQPESGDRAKAAGAALVIHLLLGAALLTGLALHIDLKRDDSLTTFDVEPPSPPPPPPPTANRAEKQTRAQPARAGRKANPSPIVAPPAKIPVERPVNAAPAPGQGVDSSAGAASSGTGTGAGGAGNGRGGGENGGVVGARLLSGALGRGDYRRIQAMGSSRGEAELLLLVNQLGRVERCRALRSSGYPEIDGALCQMLLDSARFSPAHAVDGSTYFQDVHYFPRWGP